MAYSEALPLGLWNNVLRGCVNEATWFGSRENAGFDEDTSKDISGDCGGGEFCDDGPAFFRERFQGSEICASARIWRKLGSDLGPITAENGVKRLKSSLGHSGPVVHGTDLDQRLPGIHKTTGRERPMRDFGRTVVKEEVNGLARHPLASEGCAPPSGCSSSTHALKERFGPEVCRRRVRVPLRVPPCGSSGPLPRPDLG
jgi:hypothetical protein